MPGNSQHDPSSQISPSHGENELLLDDELDEPTTDELLEDELDKPTTDELLEDELEELLESFFGVNWTSILS